MPDLGDVLEGLRESGLYRRLRMVESPQGPEVLLDGEPVLLLCSNNYLGLADHSRVRCAASDAAMHWGASAGASRLVSGTMPLHAELEGRLAELKGKPAALLFGSGYLANAGVVSALAREGEIVFSDELNHASIIDGCRLARAETFVYRHGDTGHLAWGLKRAGERASLIVTDGIFSMDGDIAPLPELADLSRRHRCRLMVDEAHGTGCIGPEGRGAVAAAGVGDQVDVVMGTLGKALGSYGAYVCGSQQLVEYLVNVSRPFIYSTALPPSVVAAASAALELIAERPGRVERLAANADALRAGLREEGFDVPDHGTQIVPLIVRGADDAMALCERALEHGVFAQAIRPPTVPRGTSRLRMTAIATHRVADLRRAARVIGEAARELGLAPRVAERGEAATAAGGAGAGGCPGIARRATPVEAAKPPAHPGAEPPPDASLPRAA
ncbi:MAG TPA: 8-amino-7-oxononanoate synthase [Solirubrobacterales bacterium]|nr:8-amino-7-oxononanoate synthase [Solirubrobacterales bacterium]